MSDIDFIHAHDTLVVSDLHLADAEIPNAKRPFWKRYKRAEHFIDEDFHAFLTAMRGVISHQPIELILNGDIFDFDSVMVVPADRGFKVSWLEQVRGLSSEENKSIFKIRVILDAHTRWIEALREFVLAGNRLVFVIGNHDMELHWPSVRTEILNRLNLDDPGQKRVRFCEWFYISNQDSLIEHGNQYDAYCLCSNPIHPLIKKGSRIIVRLPFGDLAGKYMINGMGFMNPHNPGSYIKSTFLEYLKYFFKYLVRTQPLLLWTWFWSAMVTMYVSLTEGLLPALRDPLTVDARIEDIAKRANASVFTVLGLKEVHVHPAIFDPMKILRELWLDRAILLALIVLGSLQFFTLLNVFARFPIYWFIGIVSLLMPVFIFYARSVHSEVEIAQQAVLHLGPLSAQIAKVKRIVQGHTHVEGHRFLDGIEMMNTGSWSPAFEDVECTKPLGVKCFAWIKPGTAEKGPRIGELYGWTKKGYERILPS